MFEIGIMIVMIGITVAIVTFAITACQYIEQRTKRSIPSDAEKRLNERMDELDRRLTDIQDILITIDEKFDRSPIAR